MKHILGMAKSYLDLKGSKTRNLELDFLRLLCGVSKLRGDDQEAHGYLVVFDERVAEAANRWHLRYASKDQLDVVFVKLSPDERRSLEREKERNRAGNSSEHRKRLSDSRADLATALGERKLCELISKKEPGVKRGDDKTEFPLGIDWDYYGQRK